jgi:hypothetical protein
MTRPELSRLTDLHRLLRIDPQPDTARIELIHDRLVAVVRQARDERLAREREQRISEEAARKEKRQNRRLLYGTLAAFFILSVVALWARSQWIETRPWGYMKNLATGTVYALKGNMTSMGRSIEGYFTNQISLIPRSVSRVHALLSRDYTLLDMRSLIGTTVNADFLPYGESAKLTDGDIVVLGGVAPFEFEIIKYSPLQLWVPPSKRPPVPRGWAMLIDGRARATHYLTEAEQFVDMDSEGRLQVHVSETARYLMKINRDQDSGRITIEDRQDEVDLWVVMKDGDYTYPKCRILSGQVPMELDRNELEDCDFWLRRPDFIESWKGPHYFPYVSFHYGQIPFQIVPILRDLESASPDPRKGSQP